MRFFSSSALASAEKLRLAANCSAAETMILAPERPIYSSYRALSAGLSTEHGNNARASQDRPPPPYPPPLAGEGREGADFGGASTLTAPPAFSTAAIADLDAPWTANCSATLISPRPSRRTPSLARRNTPPRTKASTSTVSLVSRAPRSTAAWMRSRFTSLSSSAKMLLKPRFGSRRCSGIWPPSKPLMRTPVRAVWPLPPRPPVLPFPDPMPRPTRMRPWRAPALSEISLSFMAHVLCGTRASRSLLTKGRHVEPATIGRLGGRDARAPVTSLQQRARDARLWRSSHARTACPQAR